VQLYFHKHYALYRGLLVKVVILSFKGFPRQPVLWPGETLLLKCIELFCRALPCKWILGFGWVFSFLVLLCSCSFLFVPLNYRKGERTYYRGTLSGNGLFCRSCAKTTALFTSEFLPFLQGYQPQAGTSYGQVTISQSLVTVQHVCDVPIYVLRILLFVS